MYSRLAFTKPTDRSMGIIGIEQRLARTFKTEGDYGIFALYLHRSLMWKREGSDKLVPIEYPSDRTVPSWSWMAYSGPISYVEAPFDRVLWNKNDLVLPFEGGRLRNSTQTRTGKPEPEIEAPLTMSTLMTHLSYAASSSEATRRATRTRGDITS